MAANRSVLMVVTSADRIDADKPTGLWFEEFAVPFQLFREHGYDVLVASPKGGATPIDPQSEPEDTNAPENRAALDALRATRPLKEVDHTGFDAVFLPGGHGTMFDLPDNPELIPIINDLARSGRVVAAVCHGPAGLVGPTMADGTPVVNGKRVTAFSNQEETAVALDKAMPFLLEDRLRQLGATVTTAEPWTEYVVVDGNLVTGQNPQSSAAVARAVIAHWT